MPDQISLLGNVVILVAYAAISGAIAVPVIRAGQLRTNKLAVATALIFFSCAVGHASHAWMAYRDLTHAAPHAMANHAAGVPWSSALWDLVTAGVAVYYWSLRRGYAVLLGKGAIYVDPWGQHRIDQAGAREQAARDAAETHRATLTAVVEHTDDAVIGATIDGVISAWNRGAERLFGYPAEEAIGRPATMLADQRGAAEQAQVLLRVRRGERGIVYEAHRRRKDGTVVQVSFTVAPIEDAAGAVIGIAIVARDITAAKQAAERQLAIEHRTQQTQRLESLGKLAGGIAHDFNNILAIIANYTDFAAEQTRDHAEVQADLANVRAATDRAIDLTGQLLTFTRGDTIQPRNVDLNAAVTEVHAMLQRTIGEHITVRTVQASRPLIVHADPGKLQQVLLNLAVNARDAMPEGGTLVLETHPAVLDGEEPGLQPPLPAGAYARLVVSDTGHGIPADIAAHIFEPFYTTKPRGRGTGLGLATVYGIVTEAGGSIHLYSEPDLGTTFRIYLPLVGDSVEDAVTTLPGGKPAHGGGRTVLVVEDEPALARVVARILTNGGYRPLVAADTAQAIAMHAAHGCDLLLTDVIMPEMSGPRLAQRLREHRPHLPVLYMSGYSNGLLGTTHILDPDVALIEKPFTTEQLLRAVAHVLTTVPIPQPMP